MDVRSIGTRARRRTYDSGAAGMGPHTPKTNGRDEVQNHDQLGPVKRRCYFTLTVSIMLSRMRIRVCEEREAVQEGGRWRATGW